MKKAIGRHQTVREAWAAIEELNPKQADIEAAAADLQAINGRVAIQNFQPQDRERLEELLSWLERSCAKVADQRFYLDHIRTMVEAEQSELSDLSAERSGP
jgi:hypothetical protein